MRDLGGSVPKLLAILLAALGACAGGPTSAPRKTVAEYEAAALTAIDPSTAAQHRAAAQALLAEERAQCSGQDVGLGVTAPFFRTDEVDRVSWVLRWSGKRRARLLGATVHLREGADAIATRSRLGCYLARIAAQGSSSPVLRACPLAVAAVRAEVKVDASRVRVQITSDDRAAAEEVWTRAQQLAHSRDREE